MSDTRLHIGDCREILPELPQKSVQMCVDLAYCAGVIDSDGYIGVKRSTYAMRVVGDCSQPAYSERVGVKQVEPEAVTLLYRLFGGTLRIENRNHGRNMYQWQVTDKKAAACLLAVLPYLKIKRAQADNALVLRNIKEKSKTLRVAYGRGHAGSASRSAKHSESMQACYEKAKKLNGR